MKQYIVDRHTDPSNPTLVPVPSERIPVYDTKAEMESDLANLGENEFAFTKDTGTELSQPVNVVEEGNLHAVTSNAVAGLTEKVTTTTNSSANVKWVDMPSGFTEQNCFVIGAKLYHSNNIYCVDTAIQILMSNTNVNQIGIVVTNSAFYNRSIDILLMKK